MLESYFFIPGDKKKYLSKIKDLDADFFVIDFEDAVSPNNKTIAFENIMGSCFPENVFIRLPISQKIYSKEQIKKLVKKFNGRVVLPKISNKKEIKAFIKLNKNVEPLSLIVLIENPKAFININKIIKASIPYIFAIGFGSHDFCSITGIKHSSSYLNFYSNYLIAAAKAFDIKYIDSVEMNIKETESYSNACKTAYEKGADGKFIIHPNQLNTLNNTLFFSDSEISTFHNVLDAVKKTEEDSLDIITVDGVVYEKPHIDRIKRILSKKRFNNIKQK